MESPLAQRMERLWMSLLMIVASSSAFRRSLLPPKGSSIEADWSKRKMKHPGFFRLVSALYMLAPCLRFLACVDFVERDVDLVAPPIPHQEPAVLPLEDGDLVPAPKRHLVAFGRPSLHVHGQFLRLDDRGDRRHRARSLHVEGGLLRLGHRTEHRHWPLAGRSCSHQRSARGSLADPWHVGVSLADERRHPADQGQRDQRDPEVEQLERTTDVAASAGRTRRTGIPLGKPLQTACSAPQKSLFRHGSGLRVRLVRLRAPSTPQLPHIRISSEIAPLRTCAANRRPDWTVWPNRADAGRGTYRRGSSSSGAVLPAAVEDRGIDHQTPALHVDAVVKSPTLDIEEHDAPRERRPHLALRRHRVQAAADLMQTLVQLNEESARHTIERFCGLDVKHG